MITIYFDIG